MKIYFQMKAWCCWNEEVINSFQECAKQHQLSESNNDPWKERSIDYNSNDWMDCIIKYTMHHRSDQYVLGTIA
jgi:hypothetical protein